MMLIENGPGHIGSNKLVAHWLQDIWSTLRLRDTTLEYPRLRHGPDYQITLHNIKSALCIKQDSIPAMRLINYKHTTHKLQYTSKKYNLRIVCCQKYCTVLGRVQDLVEAGPGCVGNAVAVLDAIVTHREPYSTSCICKMRDFSTYNGRRLATNMEGNY